MELNLVMAILERDRREEMEAIFESMDLPLALTVMGSGTATMELLSLYGLVATEKAVLSTIADAEQTQQLMRMAKRKLYIDIPGNGIMMSVPIKSIGGGLTMAYLTNNKTHTGEKPKMHFDHELIYTIINEGYSDMVMAAARPAGATGGTVISGKGTGIRKSEKFMGISLADEKDVVMIVAPADKKAAIMKEIIEKAGASSPAGAMCFSLPVSQVVGLRVIEEEDK